MASTIPTGTFSWRARRMLLGVAWRLLTAAAMLLIYDTLFNNQMQVGQFSVPDPDRTSLGFIFVRSMFITVLSGLALALRRRQARMLQMVQDRRASDLFDAAAHGTSGAFFLYVRPFAVTNELGFANAAHRRSELRVSHWSQPENIDLETALEKALRRSGPLVALGQPGENLGAGRIVATEEHWREAFESMARRARLIFTIPSDHAGTLWEMRWLVAHGAVSNCVFLMPPEPKKSRLNLRRDWAAAAAALGHEGLTLPPYTPQGMLFRVDALGRVACERPLSPPSFCSTWSIVARCTVRGQIRNAVRALRIRRDPLTAAVREVAVDTVGLPYPILGGVNFPQEPPQARK